MRTNLKRHQIVLVLFIVLSFPVCAMSAQQDISTGLSRAQTFYKGQQFQESLILLSELEKRIGANPESTSDLAKIKLYMGFSYLGLKEYDQAKSKLLEVCKLDGNYVLDPKEYPPAAVS